MGGCRPPSHSAALVRALVVQQPMRADQIDPLLLGLSQQPLSQLLLIHIFLRCHVLQRLSHGLTPFGSDQTRSTVSLTDPILADLIRRSDRT